MGAIDGGGIISVPVGGIEHSPDSKAARFSGYLAGRAVRIFGDDEQLLDELATRMTRTILEGTDLNRQNTLGFLAGINGLKSPFPPRK
jgi:hypothetical protein